MDNQTINNDPKNALLERLGQSMNILVAVSSNPSVDQLAACLGLTLWLNKIGKHATAVFSGEVPSTLEFLEPEATLEKTTDSLRDFIIALDKSKADKLRYKVEDTVVKIFITPYRTSLSADDLDFSQGDFNVDMVIALGVSVQEDLDTAITAHGRILHDAAVASITIGQQNSELGSINWHVQDASSLSEVIVDLGNTAGRVHLDGQIATALLTGIVAETARFSNEKTTPQTMSISAELMTAGANQQLVAMKLEEPIPEPEQQPEESTPESDEQLDQSSAEKATEPPKANDGTIEIAHELNEDEELTHEPDSEHDAESDMPTEKWHSDAEEASPEEPDSQSVISPARQTDLSDGLVGMPENSSLVTEPPQLGGTLTANSRPEDQAGDPNVDPLSGDNGQLDHPALRQHETVIEPLPQTIEEPMVSNEDPAMQPAPDSWMPPQPWMEPAKTLSEIEESVASPHAQQPDLDSARDEVMRAMNSAPLAPTPIEALNAQPIALNVEDEAATANQPVDSGLTTPVEQPFTMPLPTNVAATQPTPVLASVSDPNAPPPVPPPLMPPGFPQS